jgi:hypothetical protein
MSQETRLEDKNATIQGAIFSIERFLRKAEIDENDLDRYRLFLEEWGLTQEKDLRLLTEDRLLSFAKEYESEHKGFKLSPKDAALIAETAKNWFQTTNGTKNHS